MKIVFNDGLTEIKSKTISYKKKLKYVFCVYLCLWMEVINFLIYSFKFNYEYEATVWQMLSYSSISE